MLRSAFIALSQNRPLRSFSERSAAGKRLSSRFVAGMTVPEVLKIAEQRQAAGMATTLDSLGESVFSPEEAEKSASIYHQLLDAIAARRLRDRSVCPAAAGSRSRKASTR